MSTKIISRKVNFSTVAAIATPLGAGGVGVIRISGPLSHAILVKIFRTKAKVLEHGKIYRGFIYDPLTNEEIDDVLAFLLKTPHSYTGEDTVEISGHGGIITLSKILDLTLKNGAKLAPRGEFTKRAFLNGHMDLAQAEAVCDIIHAKTPAGSSIAFDQLRGKLSRQVHTIRNQLLAIISEMEAAIDFGDDVGAINMENIKAKLNDQRHEIEYFIGRAEEGHIMRTGARVAIVGRTNVGKSTVFNRLLEEERTIVNQNAGTTRDFIEESVNIHGLPITLIDTAGLRKSEEEIEQMSMDKTREKIIDADLLLWVLDASEPLRDNDRDMVTLLQEKRVLVALNKIDKNVLIDENTVNSLYPGIDINRIAALTGVGMDELKLQIKNMIARNTQGNGNLPLLTNIRHKDAMGRAARSIGSALEAISVSGDIELPAMDIKEAIVALGEVTGETVSEEIINRIFDNFCVGK